MQFELPFRVWLFWVMTVGKIATNLRIKTIYLSEHFHASLVCQQR